MVTFRDRLAVARNILDRPWVKWALVVWGIIAAYDAFVSQFVPKETAEKFPKMYELIASTSGWLPLWGWLLVLAVILVIAAIEYAARKHHPRNATTARTEFMTARTDLMHEFQAGRWRIALPPDEPLIADCTFKDLFLQICPTLFKDGDPAQRQTIAEDVKDKLATGRLNAWGRKLEQSHRLPLSEIPKEYWLQATFVFNFLGDGSWGARSQEAGEYVELRVNRAQVIRVFFVSIKDGARIAYESAEDTLYGALSKRMNKTVTERIADHISAFLNRKMELLGKSPPSSRMRSISDDEKPLLKWSGASDSLVSRYPAQPLVYEDVVVSRYDLEKYCEFLRRIDDAKC